MIKVLVKKNNNELNEIVISGHAGYDVYGKDIVCSAVSSIVTTSVNGILTINDTIIVKDDLDKLIIKVKENNDITNKLLLNMLDLLKELNVKYPKNIKIRWEGE